MPGRLVDVDAPAAPAAFVSASVARAGADQPGPGRLDEPSPRDARRRRPVVRLIRLVGLAGLIGLIGLIGHRLTLRSRS